MSQECHFLNNNLIIYEIDIPITLDVIDYASEAFAVEGYSEEAFGV